MSKCHLAPPPSTPASCTLIESEIISSATAKIIFCSIYHFTGWLLEENLELKEVYIVNIYYLLWWRLINLMQVDMVDKSPWSVLITRRANFQNNNDITSIIKCCIRASGYFDVDFSGPRVKLGWTQRWNERERLGVTALIKYFSDRVGELLSVFWRNIALRIIFAANVSLRLWPGM